MTDKIQDDRKHAKELNDRIIKEFDRCLYDFIKDKYKLVYCDEYTFTSILYQLEGHIPHSHVSCKNICSNHGWDWTFLIIITNEQSKTSDKSFKLILTQEQKSLMYLLYNFHYQIVENKEIFNYGPLSPYVFYQFPKYGIFSFIRRFM